MRIKVDWNTQNDHELWDTISRTSTGQQVVDCLSNLPISRRAMEAFSEESRANR